MLRRRVDDEFHIDAKGSPSAPSDEAKKRLSQNPGTWKLLSTSPELFLALKERTDGLMGDLSQLQPTAAVLAGDLAEMQPSDLLNFLHQGRRTGVLLTRSDSVERGIAMTDGNVAWACSTSPGERLGELLCRTGLAARARVQAALGEQAGTHGQHRRIGQILVEKRVIGPDELWSGLRHQTVEIFLGLLVAQAGSFVFLRGLDRGRLPAVLNLDTQGLLLDGLRRLDEMELYRTTIPTSDVFLRKTAKKVPANDDELSSQARQILELADGKRSIADLAAITAFGEFEVTKAAYKLIDLGYAEAVRTR